MLPGQMPFNHNVPRRLCGFETLEHTDRREIGVEKGLQATTQIKEWH